MKRSISCTRVTVRHQKKNVPIWLKAAENIQPRSLLACVYKNLGNNLGRRSVHEKLPLQKIAIIHPVPARRVGVEGASAFSQKGTAKWEQGRALMQRKHRSTDLQHTFISWAPEDSRRDWEAVSD